MKLKDAILRSVYLLGMEEEVDLAVDGLKRNRLIDCGNSVYAEIAGQYVHLKTVEPIEFSDGRAYYTDFGFPVREILSVKDNRGEVPFEMTPTYVAAKAAGTVEVRYVYHPLPAGLEDDLLLPPQYTEHIVAQGIAAEYCYRTGLVDEAMFYQARFESAVTNIARRIRPANLPARKLL